MKMKTPQSRQSVKELSKFGASYDAGLTIEADPNSSPPKLAIDGKRILIEKVGRSFGYSEKPHSLKRPALSSLAKRIVDISWDRKKREETREQHLAELHKGWESWDRWRKEHPEIRPLLFGAPLRNQKLSKFNFSNANLVEADLRGVTLIDANFHEANLGGAKLIRAKLMGANFCRTDLFETNLSRGEKESSTTKRFEP